MHKKTPYLNIPHQVFECRSTNTISIYHSLAQLESNTTFFTSPGTKNGGATHTYIAPYKHVESVCVEKNLKKIPTDPRTHRKMHEKNHWHKEGLPKTSIRTFVRNIGESPTRTHFTTKLRMCAWCTASLHGLNLALACGCAYSCKNPKLQQGNTQRA